MKKPLLLLLIVTLCACGSKVKKIEVNHEGLYSLTIPNSLTESSNLNEDASLQYQNVWKEFYLVTIDEPKEELRIALESNNLAGLYENNIDGYSDLIIGNMNRALNNAEQSDVQDTMINGHRAKLTTISGGIDDLELFYYLGIFEGEENFYQVITWTLKSKEETHKANMRDIIQSMKILKD
ncbi:hypothetical protein [Roseivirga sp.]|uniref:hypothetical protein n=1 Tax=Roseivirga sp. TaxID=1964215 RepID=UPI003B51FE25